MPSLLHSRSAREAKDDNKPRDVLPPPAYTDVPDQSQPSDSARPPPDASHVDITAAFATLSLGAKPRDPTADDCLAHLKLLFAIQSMKDDVGYTDGLWGIWDSLADSDDMGLDDLDAGENLPGLPAEKQKITPDDRRKIRLSKLREKRWALFVARAVDRYETWWNTLPVVMLCEQDMRDTSPSAYHGFVHDKNYTTWTKQTLPPLDVVMVYVPTKHDPSPSLCRERAFEY